MNNIKLKRFLKISILIIGMLGMGMHVNPIAAQGNDAIVIGVTDSISNLDPADAYDYFSSNTLVQITHGLMEMPVDSTTAEKGPIVESYDVNDDATVYTFNLKEGIQFSDGEPFNAEAVKWNFERVIDLNGDPGFLISSVLNTSNGASIEVVDDYTIKFTLSSADATFLQRLTYTVAWPISPESLSETELQGDPETIPAGLGPYVVSSWTKGTELILEPNENYFGDAPENDQVIIRFYSDASALLTALESGEVDIAQKQFGPDEMASIMDNDNLNYTTKDTAGIRYLVINNEAHPDKNVRQAIAAAVNRSEITSTIYDDFNNPLHSMVPEIFDSSIDAFDDGPDQTVVQNKMEASGYSSDNKYEMDFWYSPSHYGSQENNVAELIKTQLEDTGYFDITIKNAEWSTYVEQFTTMGFFLLGWWFDYPDPSNYIDPFVGSGSYSLGVNYSSSTMDGYIDTMLTDPDQADRDQAVKDAQNLMAEDAPVVPLFSMVQQFSAYHSGVEGFVLEPSENVHYNTITKSGDSTVPFGFFLPTAFFLMITAVVVDRIRNKKQ